MSENRAFFMMIGAGLMGAIVGGYMVSRRPTQVLAQPTVIPAKPAAPIAEPFSNLPLPPTPHFQDVRLRDLPPVDPASLPTVNFSPIRHGTISMPLGDTGDYEVYFRIATSERKFVTSGDRTVTNAYQFEAPLQLKPGSYVLTVTAMKLADRSKFWRQIEFEVK